MIEKNLLLYSCFVFVILSVSVPTPFATNDPSWPHVTHPLKPSSLWGPNIKAPYPTNTWWINAVLDAGDNVVATQPYSTWLKQSGLLVSNPSKIVGNNGQYVSRWYSNGIQLGFQGSASHQVIGYDDFSVTAKYSIGSQSLVFPLVRGSPYITGQYSNGLLPVISFDKCNITSINGQTTPGSIKGNRFVIQLSTEEQWVIYTDVEGTFTWSLTSISAQSSPSSVWTIRLAVVPSASTSALAILDQYVGCIPFGGQLSIDLSSELSAQLSANFAVIESAACTDKTKLLLTVYPHMLDVVDLKGISLVYDSLTGPMTGVVGNIWSWTEVFVNVSWYASKPIDPSRVADITAQLKEDLKFTGMAPDTYDFGKGICRIARLALIAEEINRPDLAEVAYGILEVSFQPWIQGTGTDAIMYDTTWFGTPPRVGLQDKSQDFGAGYYNDHHFHFGYWLYAAAVLAKGNSTWAAANREKFTSLARDIANPSKDDPYFTVFRHTDFFAGHSWASGLFPFTDGRNQESSSECLNAWYGLSLYGKAIGDSNMEKIGKMLLAHELRGAKRYWHSTSASTVYPAQFAANKCAGMVWTDKVDINTWFGAGIIYGHGINMIPFTPFSEFYLTKDWVTEEYPVALKAIQTAPPADSWKAVFYLDHAVIDPTTAWQEIATIRQFDDGMSRTNAMWWISTRP